MTRRYFVPELPTKAGMVSLPSAEAQHATRVMRVQPGDAITLFDGKGSESKAVISQVARNECWCDTQPCVRVDREPSTAIHMGIALPKPDRARELIERLTELGVKSITPLVAERTQRAPSDGLLEKLRRGVIEACKQCCRNELLEVRAVQNASDYFTSCTSPVRLIAHRSDDSVPLGAVIESASVSAAVGPEGGWADDEVRMAIEHGFKPVHLGERIYRIETAATVIASVMVT